MSLTLFEKIINKEIPADILYEDDISIVIKDISPQAPTHLLIIPKKVIPKLSDATAEDQKVLGHLMLIAGKIADGTYERISLILSLNISFFKKAIIKNLVRKVIKPQKIIKYQLLI